MTSTLPVHANGTLAEVLDTAPPPFLGGSVNETLNELLLERIGDTTVVRIPSSKHKAVYLDNKEEMERVRSLQRKLLSRLSITRDDSTADALIARMFFEQDPERTLAVRRARKENERATELHDGRRRNERKDKKSRKKIAAIRFNGRRKTPKGVVAVSKRVRRGVVSGQDWLTYAGNTLRPSNSASLQRKHALG